MATVKEDGNVDGKIEIFCDPCQVENEDIVAVCFCVECNIHLCRHCDKVHKRLPLTREHIVKEDIGLQDKRSHEESKTGLLEKCLSHREQVIDHYCISHDELCCSICLSKSHQNCQDVRNISEYMKDFDIDQEQSELEGEMHGLTNDIDKTQYLVQTRLKAVELNHEVAQSEMLKVKQAAFEHIEAIHNTVKKQLNETREDDTKNIIPYKNKCDAITFDIQAMTSYLKAKKKDKYRSFVAMKRARFKIKSNRDDLNVIKHKKYLNIRRFYFQLDQNMIKLKMEPYRFGTLENKKNAIKSTCLVASLKAKDLDEKNSCCVTGLAVLGKNHIIIADHGNLTVKLVEVEEDKILSKLQLTYAPWDVTVITDKQIAVTIPEIKTVHFASVDENMTLYKQEKQINLTGKCFGITSSHDTIIITLCEPTPKYEQYDLDGNLLHSIPLENAKNPQYIVLNTDKTHMYISDATFRKHIQEISVADQRITDTLRIESVFGMAVDKTDVLYCCLGQSYSIQAVCIDKIQDNQRQNGDLALDNFSGCPRSLAFCDETNRLFVGIGGDRYIM